MSFGQQRIWQNVSNNMIPAFQPQQNNMYVQNMQPTSNSFPSDSMQQNYGAANNGPVITYPDIRVQVPNNSQPPQFYNSTGTVSKVNSECGLINDEVFFYKSTACKGGYVPQLGDRVMFEATFSATGQFKYNAERVQLMMPAQQHPMSTPDSSDSNLRKFNCIPPPREYSPHRDYHRISHERRERSDRSRRSREREEDNVVVKRRREDHSDARVGSSKRSYDDYRRDRDVSRERQDRFERDRKDFEKEREKIDRDRSPYASLSRSRHHSRSNRHYDVNIPTYTLTSKEIDYYELRKRHALMHIPSNFFLLKQKWLETFTPDNPFPLNRPSQFFCTHKSIPPPFELKKEEIDPTDEDHSYVVMVVLPAFKSQNQIYKQCFEEDETQQVKQFFSFLIRNNRKTKTKTMIGGAWSPSLDGQSPEKDPSVLIKTAIRVCRASLGVDLSKCSQWYRFCELYFKNDPKAQQDGERCSSNFKTVVIFIPDINSCMPTPEEWEQTRNEYKKLLNQHVFRLKTPGSNNEPAANAAVENADTSSMSGETTQPSEGCDNFNKQTDAKASLEDAAVSPEQNDADQKTKDQISVTPTNEEDNESTTKNLDAKTMKIQEIRDALIARNLSPKGPRSAIVARLTKALNSETSKDKETNSKGIEEQENNEAQKNGEKEDENKKKSKQNESENAEQKLNEDSEDWGNVNDVDMNDIVILDEYDAGGNPEEALKIIDEAEKERLIRRYALPSSPCILVSGGKHSYSLVRYSALFSKTSSFEVMVFAEIFNDMLTRDFGFNIYQELVRQSKSDKYKTKKETEKSKTAHEKKEKEEGKIDHNKQEETDDKSSGDKNNEKTNQNQSNSKDKDDDNNSTSSTRKRKLNSEKASDRNVEKKTFVARPELLLSLFYFDTSRCGYIYEKDLRDLFSILGLRLSRGQLNHLFDKLSIRQTFYYRKFTHKEEASPEILAIDNVADSNNYFEELKKLTSENMVPDDYVSEKNSATTTVSSEQKELVNYNGTIVDVEKLTEQIRRLEKSYADLEKTYTDCRKNHHDLKERYYKATWKVENLESEVKHLYSINRKYRLQQTTITEVYNLLTPLVSREKERDRDRDRRTESSHHKDANERDKDKDKQKEKDPNKGKDSTKPQLQPKDNGVEDKKEKDSASKTENTAQKEIPKNKNTDVINNEKDKKQDKPDGDKKKAQDLKASKTEEKSNGKKSEAKPPVLESNEEE